jgi:hypothetical protein
VAGSHPGPAAGIPAVGIRVPVRLRTRHPEAAAEAAARRVRRPLLRGDGRLLAGAAGHPARGALGVGGRTFAMADRAELLGRLRLVLSRPGVDGVLATADILDDLLLGGEAGGRRRGPGRGVREVARRPAAARGARAGGGPDTAVPGGRRRGRRRGHRRRTAVRTA